MPERAKSAARPKKPAANKPVQPVEVSRVEFTNTKGKVQAVRQHKRCAIVGFAPSSKDDAPYTDKSVDIWGVNELYKFVPRVDVLFELHAREMFTSKKRNPGHLKWLQNATIPIFLNQEFDDIPSSIMFPYDEVKAKMQTSYFTNSISWLLGFACWCGYEHVSLYGVDLAVSDEYEKQRPSMEYLIGKARALGVEVFISPKSDLLKATHEYGRQQLEQMDFELRLRGYISEQQNNINQRANQVREIEAQMHQAVGAKSATEHVLRVFSPERDTAFIKQLLKLAKEADLL